MKPGAVFRISNAHRIRAEDKEVAYTRALSMLELQGADPAQPGIKGSIGTWKAVLFVELGMARCLLVG
jgi:hypothetical protein